jgi:eukaryotic-like serine/threonine-protein kinase
MERCAILTPVSELPEIGSATTSSDRRIAVLGKGGFGEVELVVRSDGRFERLYARKRLHASHRGDLELLSMFFEEARLAGMIRHPNVVSVLDVGEDEQGPFLLLDYVEGVSAQKLIETARSRSEMLPMQVCLRIAMQVAEGLHAAHQLSDRDGRSLGLVHRDVSPGNILIGYDGVARVTDFGVARALGRTTRTQTGFLKGKFGYMSPEQLRFEEPDRRSDLFALGVVLFELMTARRLYANQDGMDGARRVLNEPPPDLADHRDDVPEALIELSFQLLAKSAAHRPTDARDVATRLEAIVAALVAEEGRIDVADYLSELFSAERGLEKARVSAAIAAKPEAPPPPKPRRWPWVAAAATIAIGVVFVGIGMQTAEAPSPVEMVAPSPTTAPIEVATPEPPPPVIVPAIEAPPPPPPPVATPTSKKKRSTKRAKQPKPGVPMWNW